MALLRLGSHSCRTRKQVKWPKTLLVVSHAREFLNATCTDIIHLHSKKLVAYKGVVQPSSAGVIKWLVRCRSKLSYRQQVTSTSRTCQQDKRLWGTPVWAAWLSMLCASRNLWLERHVSRALGH